MRKLQEKLIEKIFKGILNTDVRVLNLIEDEDLNFAIFNAKQYEGYSDSFMKDYAWDYGIFEEDGKWSYSIMVHYGGSYDEPPSSDSIESVETYPTFDGALHALVMNIVNENYGMISEETYYLTHEDDF